jgi:hypothetical protein
MTPRLLFLAASLLVLAGPALAADAAADTGPVSTASQSTDQKIAAWLSDKSDPVAVPDGRRDEPLADNPDARPDRRIHGEVGATVGTGGYRSAYGVVNIPIGKSSSATLAVSTGHGRYPWVAGAPWSYGPAGPGVRADCVCHEAPDGSQQCRVASAASRFDAQLAGTACEAPH